MARPKGASVGDLAQTRIEPTDAGAFTDEEGIYTFYKDTDKPYVSTGTSELELITSATIVENAQDAVGAMVDSTLVYVDATPLLSRAALTGDVTASQGSNATTIANDAVTFAKIQNITDARLLGRSAGSSGDVQEITVGAGLSLAAGSLTNTGGTYSDEEAQDAVGAMVDASLVYVDATPLLQRAALTGDVTAPAGSNTTTIANLAVTNAKIAVNTIGNARIRQSAGLSVLGRSANSLGDIADITGATVNHVLTVGAGPALAWGYHRRPHVDNPPATTHAYSDEFDTTSKDAKWTAVSAAPAAAIASGTIARLNTIGAPIYDAASTPSYMMFQSDNSSAGTFGLKQTVVTGSAATIFVKMFADNRVYSAAPEGSIMVRLYNAADTNEYVEIGLGNSAGAGQTTRAALSNNGVLTLNFIGGTRTEGNPLIESLFCIMKSSNTYYFFSGTDGSTVLTLLGSATKTVVTTMDTLEIICTTANEAPSTFYGVDFIRWYDTLASNLVNP